jgi:hypothetical protein
MPTNEELLAGINVIANKIIEEDNINLVEEIIELTCDDACERVADSILEKYAPEIADFNSCDDEYDYLGIG